MYIAIPNENVLILRFSLMKAVKKTDTETTFFVPDEYASSFIQLVGEINKNREYYHS